MKNKPDGRKNNGGAREGAGRKSRANLGLEPLVTTSVKTEQSLIDKCRELHGTLKNALIYASKKKVKDNSKIV